MKLFWAAGACYALAAAGHALWAKGLLKNARLGKTFLILAGLMHGAELVRLGAASGMFPLYDLRNALMFFSWCIVLLYGALLLRYRFEILSFFTVLLALLFILPTWLIPSVPPAVDRPALRDWVTSIHIGLSVFSYAAFCLAALAACGYLVEYRRLKEKGRQAVILRLPPLEMLETMQPRLIGIGLGSLGGGILFGFCWAVREAWSVLAEPKVVMTGFVFALYAMLVPARKRAGLTSRQYSAIVVAGFLICLISFFAVNFISSGRHQF
ncbi:MAG: hypothetical protein A3G34_09725 [Candidatus Lindowbacteria bacterium RIFCSPLOWO2_12_FULL_62_27]|nr:MAG: hypothetical protein A3G34_09725 [Candidatus Lindowbacteria bacterium RIFCSPLOWO2_12_FULL_62_27]OGH61524.1 MAG: hypothetical protein A3I06_02725 [Candidatus Lindowbacteria bacterium RIFCSPLOWO2_02_FULL_62_12]